MLARFLTLTAVAASLTTPSAAQEARVVEGMIDTAIAPDEPIATPGLALNAGGALELSYGEYGEDEGSSLSGEVYVEGELNGFYAGIWALVTDQQDDNEVDLSLGYRNELTLDTAGTTTRMMARIAAERSNSASFRLLATRSARGSILPMTLKTKSETPTSMGNTTRPMSGRFPPATAATKWWTPKVKPNGTSVRPMR